MKRPFRIIEVTPFCCPCCDRKYNVSVLLVGVPVVLGKSGMQRVIELDLNESEQAQFQKSLNHVKQLALRVDKLL